MYPDDSLTLHTDLYQINMMQVYFDQGIHNKKAVFEVYFRQQPFKNGYAVFAGLERIVSYLEDLRFSDSDIAYLESLGYHGAFLDYLRNFKLELTVRSAQEGDLVFANEPIVQVEGPLAQCQLVETALLMLQNYQFNIEIYQHNPLNVKYLSAWVITYVIYLPWVFIGNLGLKSYGEWAQKKFEQDMDELESGE